MNCPSRVDPEALPNGWNQQPNPLSLDTNADGNGIVNQRYHRASHQDTSSDMAQASSSNCCISQGGEPKQPAIAPANEGERAAEGYQDIPRCSQVLPNNTNNHFYRSKARAIARKIGDGAWKFSKFVGPGFMVAVAYIDPGNYSTDASAGAAFQFRLLFVVLLSNLIAVYLQALCVKLGSVTGLNLAENIKEHCPPWLNYLLYFFAEAAIIATDIAEVIGTAISLNMLLHIPLIAGCALSIFDVLVLLVFYQPSGSTIGLRFFEAFVALLVLAVTICFCIELSLLRDTSIGEVFRGYLPSSSLVQSDGLVQACGILGATVMPHSLYLGSGIVQPRLREYDEKHGTFPNAEDEEIKYRPSIAAIRYCLSTSITELVLILFVIALFVNSAILIVSGACLYNIDGASNASLFEVHDLLSSTLTPAAGTLFALGLLFSGIVAGIVCTIAGQIVSEGQINWTVRPWIRRLVTRSISIIPSIIIAGAVGMQGLTNALNGTQVALSVILPFTSAPLIWFTSRKSVMVVRNPLSSEEVYMQNNIFTIAIGVVIWLLIAVLNVALIVLTGLGQN
ncbi:Manganese transporter SMF1 [Talaromyces atroroseus]|uniref:Manganese transporter SMF1 n=1 Tax=Talaromyces atroroseus TaxID=1441469 RepID=A0A225AX03_TALAT|nr:Manganese transporter SMF1 [Talaromyces atroroseus]OKL61858.1 Manganese transporter SMF1 [Talaromyces atroroseus]